MDYGTDDLRAPYIKKPQIAWSINSAEREYPNANFVTRMDFPDGTSTVSYHFKIYSNDIEKRGIYTPAIFDLKVASKHADMILNTLKQHPTLLDSLFSTKLPDVARNLKDRGAEASSKSKDDISGIKPWNELIFLPSDTKTSDWKEKMQVLHRR